MRHLLSLVIGLGLIVTLDASAATVDGIPIHSSSAGKGRETVIFAKFEYIEIPGTGHFLMMEHAQEFNRLLMTLLSKVEAGL